MTDRIVVLRSNDSLSFVADVCGALAEAVSEIRLVRPGDQDLIAVYAEMVRALARLTRPALATGPSATVRLAMVDHLLGRLREAQAGEISMPVIDIVDRLHEELTRQSVLA